MSPLLACAQYKAIIYKRGDLHYVPSVVGPGDGGGGFKFYGRLMMKEHAEDRSTGLGQNGISSANARDEQMIIMPKSKDSIVGPYPWERLLEKLKKKRRLDGADALFIVQKRPSSENTDANNLHNIEKFANIVKDRDIKLTVLAVGDSYEVADFCSMEHNVLGWMNNLVDENQVNVAFKFCYNVIDQYFKNLDQSYKSLDAQSPQSTSIRSARTCATRAYLTVLGDFSFQMDDRNHAYKFGMKQDGEPCLFPDWPARPYVDWSVDMYEGRLRNAACRCMEKFKKLIEHCDLEGNKAIDEVLQKEIMYRIGVYLGWFVLIRHNPKHNLLSRKDDVYELEYSFTGELKPARAKTEFKRLTDEFKSRGIKDYVEFIENQTVDEDIFQLFKLEMIAIGESMLTGTQFFIASFEVFPYVAVSGILINDARKGLCGQDSRITILAATLSVVSSIGALIVTNNADVKRAKRMY
ncbi:Hypothetical Protein FCC1311_066442 [Hondaea fermentalgiana]|uniref:Uncharacterized protein n=1 Tax=Hondaea fermentalgiana TaxID=2315210 RepID=A0A2R5GIK1_9STRA|nr:Hypothetical Protein FCC1311_066442 [Hondaea fermentalgiana]|eukprot:GBG30425.1 Hypothetical Protein FCC1311_066442 [Hondaea fermentalgiana]